MKALGTGPRRWALIAALVGTLLVIAACGSSKPSGTAVASLKSSASSATGGTGGTKPSALAYSQCMRAHGISDFPDPSTDGGVSINGAPGSDLDPNDPRYQAADKACAALRPPPAALPANAKAQNLKYAQCMRSHGISDFPDPQADGSLQIKATPGGDLDPNNPAYQTADKACKQDLPGGGSDRPTVGN